MKKSEILYKAFGFLCLIFSITNNIKAQAFSYTLSNQNATNTLTCATPTINLMVTASVNSINCVWTNSSGSVSGNPIALTNAGTYTLVVTNIVSNTDSTKIFTIYQNTVAPVSSISPFTQTVNCNTGTTFTATAISPTANIMHEWFSPFAPYPSGPVSGTASSQSSVYNTLSGPGIYEHVLTNLVNGCTTTSNMTITSSSSFPSFNVTSANNFSVGCSPMNQTTLCIVNVVSPGPVNFLFLPPGSGTAVPSPTTAFTAQSCSVVSTQGTWTLIVNDPINNCQAALPLVVKQNTVAPSIILNVTPPIATLTCFVPNIIWTCSVLAGTDVMWQIPSIPPVLPLNTLNINTPGSYTPVITNTVNGCTTSSVVTISQNTVIPIPNQIAFGNPSVVSCYIQPVVVSYTANSAAQPPNLPVNIVQSWQGPSPQPTIGTVAQYSIYVPGTYTLTVQNNQTGCIGSHTFNVGVITNEVKGTAVYTMACTGTVLIAPAYSFSVTGNSYTWTALPGSGSFVGPNTTPSVVVNGGGQYVCTTYKPNSNCTTIDTVYVHTCVGLKDHFVNALNVKVYPNPARNYLVIEFPEIPEDVSLEIYDTQGKIILTKVLYEKSNKINFESDRGFYLYRISEKGFVVKNGKLLVE